MIDIKNKNRRTSVRALLVAGGLLCSGFLPSINAAPATARSSTPVAVAASYRLSTDDVIAVTVLRHPEMSLAEALVNTSGAVQVPGVGVITVAGKTLRQVEKEIVNRLSKTLVRPEVSVVLKQARPRRIFVLGPVAKPGIYEIQPGWRVSEALAAAGGTTTRPELILGTLNRAQGKPLSLNLKQILTDSNSPANLVLYPGDTLRLTERSINITVVGQVQKAGSLTLAPESSLLDAIAMAGGAVPRAALTRATLQRLDGTLVPVDLHKALVLGERQNLPKLQPGDVVTIPESNDRVTMLGAVGKPGFLDIPDGQTLKVTEALAQAGGPAPRAALTRASLRQANGQERQVDLYQLLILGNKAFDFALQPNDVLTIPESKGVTVVGSVAKPGTYYIEEGATPRVFDVLALAGGLNIKPEAARISIARAALNTAGSPAVPTTTANAQSTSDGVTPPATISTSGQNTVSIDAVSLLELSDLGQNERVRDGDLISVSAAKSPTVYLSGEVQKPGAYELKEGDSVPELIARAGGVTPLAILSSVSVTGRDGTSKTLNVRPAMLEGGQKLDVPLQEGDFVVVPRNKARVYVMQAVAKPGYYPIPENEPLTVGEALSMAGGPKDRAKVKEIAIFRPGPGGVQRRVISITDFENGRLAINDTLQHGDVVFVPEGRTSLSAWERITRTIGSLSVFGALF